MDNTVTPRPTQTGPDAGTCTPAHRARVSSQPQSRMLRASQCMKSESDVRSGHPSCGELSLLSRSRAGWRQAVAVVLGPPFG